MDSKEQPDFGGYIVEHEVIEECDLKKLELEYPHGSEKQRVVLHDKCYKMKKIHLSDNPPPLQKTVETWTSEPVLGRLLSATAAAHAASPGRRRLSFSMCTGCEQKNDNDDSSVKCLPTTEDENNVEEFSFDDDDVKQENIDLRQQNRKQVEDLREMQLKLHDAEDKNQSLELHIRSVQYQLITSNLRLEKANEEYLQEVELQSTKLEATTERLHKASSTLNRVEKEYRDLETEKNLIHGELEKAFSELQDYHMKNMKLKTDIQETEIALHCQRKEYSLKHFELQQENSGICLALEGLRVAFQKLEREKNELEAIANNLYMQDRNNSLSKDRNLFEEDGEEDMDSTLKFETSFLPLEFRKSIFAEIQSSLHQSPFEILGTVSSIDTGVQTDDEDISDPIVSHCQKVPTIYGQESDDHGPCRIWTVNEMTNQYYEEVPFVCETRTVCSEHLDPFLSNDVGIFSKISDQVIREIQIPWSWKKTWQGMKVMLVITIIILLIIIAYRFNHSNCAKRFDIESAMSYSYYQPPRI